MLTPLTVAHMGTGGELVTLKVAVAWEARLASVPTTKSSLGNPGVPLSSVRTIFETRPPVDFEMTNVFPTWPPGAMKGWLADLTTVRHCGGWKSPASTVRLVSPAARVTQVVMPEV